MRYFFLLLMICPWLTFSQGSWQIMPFPGHQHINSISFPDSTTGWAAGDSGMICKTTDGGHTWAVQQANTINDIAAVFFIDKNEGWASTFNYSQAPYGTLLLHTTDGGDTWQQILYPEENVFIHAIFFFDHLNGWMGGSPHALAKTTDGGITWNEAAIDTSTLAFFPVETIKFYDHKYGYASGGIFDVAGVIWSTDNGGVSWRAIDPSQAPADEVHGLHLYDSVHVIGAGGDPDFGYGVGMTRTNDGGLNWTYSELSMQGTATDIAFRNEAEAWAPLGSRRTMIFSLDSGNTWSEVSSPDSAVIIKVSFPDSLHGYAAGRNGTFLRYNPAVIGISDHHPSGNVAISPNPAGNILYVKLNNQDQGSCFEILDLSGRILRSEVIPAATDQFSLDLSGLPSGFYILKHDSGSLKFVKK